MSTLAPAPVLVMPKILLVPDYVAGSSAGAEAVDLAGMAGLDLDPWQAFVLEHSLGERPDGRWAAPEVGLEVSRQNGKGSILEARELAGLFLLGERLITHSAHQFDTSLEAFRRLLILIENTPELDRRVKRVSRSHGEEGIELIGGQRIRFRTRTRGGGRGFTGDLLILDEAMIYPEASHGALLPTLSARPNPQIWYVGSSVDQEIHEHGVVFARVRARALAHQAAGLAYFGWTADPDPDNPLDPGQVPDEIASDHEAWAQANPSMGIRISSEYVDLERRSMDPRTFAVERLGIGDWPATDAEGDAVIPIELWAALTDATSTIPGSPVIAYDVSPDRRWTAISAAGRRDDGLMHAELIERRAGTDWVPGRLLDIQERHHAGAVRYAAGSPAAALAPVLTAVGVAIEETTTQDFAKACALFYDRVLDGTLRHLGAAELDAAIRAAVKRPLVDSWAWSRTASKGDITALVSATVALWGAHQPAAHPWAEAW